MRCGFASDVEGRGLRLCNNLRTRLPASGAYGNRRSRKSEHATGRSDRRRRHLKNEVEARGAAADRTMEVAMEERERVVRVRIRESRLGVGG
jgi:hypothetical protein